MSLQIASLSSGSNGNCYYVGNDREGILIDAGISCKEAEKRLKSLGIEIGHIKAIFISHEHADHIHGLRSFLNKLDVSVYMTPKTQTAARLLARPNQIIPFKPYVEVKVGELTISAFPKQHDAADPHSFVVSNASVTVGVFTDIGKPCNHLLEHFEKCHAAFLEANYDEMMLENGRYPKQLKKRIRGGSGHLSNSQALKVFTSKRPDFMSHLFLSHLSENNNKPEIVLEMFERESGNTKIIIAPRTEATALYTIESNSNSRHSTEKMDRMQYAKQLSLF